MVTNYLAGRGMIANILIGIFIYFIFSFYLHLGIFKYTTNEKTWLHKALELLKKIIKPLVAIIRFLNIDYYLADLFKKKPPIRNDGYNKIVKHEKINKKNENEYDELLLKEYIENSNLANLFISIIILLFVSFRIIDLFPFFIFNILFSIVLIRSIMRSFEIINAFYKDIKEDKKKSSLEPGDRIGLAVKSYFEIIVNFTCVYYLLASFCGNFQFSNIDALKLSDGIFSFMLYSLGIATFTNVKFNDESIIVNAFVVLQLISCMCLTYFALAKYIGTKRDDDENSDNYKNVNNVEKQEDTVVKIKKSCEIRPIKKSKFDEELSICDIYIFLRVLCKIFSYVYAGIKYYSDTYKLLFDKRKK